MPDFLEPTPELFPPAGAADLAVPITLTVKGVPTWRRDAVAAHVGGWLTEWLSTVTLADEETGTTYTYAAESGAPNGQGAAAEILRIVSDWCVESNNQGGIDAGDLAWRLEQAGYPLPEED